MMTTDNKDCIVAEWMTLFWLACQGGFEDNVDLNDTFCALQFPNMNFYRSD